MNRIIRQVPWERIAKFSVMNTALWFLNIAIAIVLISVGVYYLLASFVGIMVHIIIAFFLNRQWVFRKESIETKSGLMRTGFAEVFITSTMLITMYVLVDGFGFAPEYIRPVASIPSGILAWVLHSWMVFREHPFRVTKSKR